MRLLPPEVGSRLTKLYKVAEDGGTNRDRLGYTDWLDANVSRYKEFNRILSELSRDISEKQIARLKADADIHTEHELLLMAKGATLNPNKLQELVDFYQMPKRKPGAYGPPVLFPPSLQEKHCSEEYRYAWEVLLLAPPTEQTVHLYAGPHVSASEALGRTRNPSSIPLIVLAFKMTCVSEQLGLKTLDHQLRLIFGLNHFRNQAALEAMFECLEYKRSSGQSMDKTMSRYTLVERVERLVTDQENYNYKDDWMTVLKAYDASHLRLEYQAIIKRAKATETKQP